MTSRTRKLAAPLSQALRDPSANAAIEFALAGPLLALLALGMFSAAIHVESFLRAQNAARAIARMQARGVNLEATNNQDLVLGALGNSGWLVRVTSLVPDSGVGGALVVADALQFGDTTVTNQNGSLPTSLPTSGEGSIVVAEVYHSPDSGLPSFVRLDLIYGRAVF